MVGPRSPRTSVMVKPLGLDIEVRDVVAGVRCALQELVVFAPVPPSPPPPMRREYDRVEPVADKTAGPQVTRMVGIDLADTTSLGGCSIFAARCVGATCNCCSTGCATN